MAALRTRPKNFHGIKGRSGRKPTAATVLKRRIIENKVEEAEASFAFLVAMRDNDTEPSALRLQAAGMILDRVLGKSKEHLEHSGSVNLDHIDVVVHGGNSDSDHSTDLQ